MTEEPVEVIHADRQAAADLFCDWFKVVPHASVPTNMRCGNEDDHEFVIAFARHRISHSAEKEALIEALEAIADMATQPLASSLARSTLLSMRNNGNG